MKLEMKKVKKDPEIEKFLGEVKRNVNDITMMLFDNFPESDLSFLIKMEYCSKMAYEIIKIIYGKWIEWKKWLKLKCRMGNIA